MRHEQEILLYCSVYFQVSVPRLQIILDTFVECDLEVWGHS